MLKAFWPLFLLTASLHYYFHFTWYQYWTGLFRGNIVLLLTVLLLTSDLSYLYFHYWHSLVNNDYAESFLAFILINCKFTLLLSFYMVSILNRPISRKYCFASHSQSYDNLSIFFLTSMFRHWGMICFISISLFLILPSMFFIPELTLSRW